MSKSILVIGESGSGKSTSIEHLDPTTTFIINIVGKDLPFKGGKKNNTKYSKESGTGNMTTANGAETILKIMDAISSNEKLSKYKTIIIDDYQYIMSIEFMERAKEKGYDKFNELAQNAFSVLLKASKLRDDLTVIILAHSDKDESGKVQLKTLGKMLREKMTPEGLFTIVLVTDKAKNEDGVIKHYFITNSDTNSIAKSPRGMFEAQIDNDLKFVLEKIKEYDEGE